MKNRRGRARRAWCAPWSRLTVAASLLLAVVACGTEPSPPQPGAAAESAGDARRLAIDLLVTGGTVVTMNTTRQVIADGAVAIDGGAILEVGPANEVAARYEAARTLRPQPHDIVMPGLINGHNHAPMTLLRGVADDMRLMDWLENYIFPAEGTLVDPGFVRTGTALAALEMIRGGTTTFVDMYYFEDEVASVARDAGLRAILGETLLDTPTPDAATIDEALAYTEAFLQNWQQDPRITAAVAPHAPYTVGPESLQRAAALARRYEAPLLIHLAETDDEVQQIRASYGASPVQHLDRIGFLGPDVIGAHSVWVDAADIATLAERGVGVVHNPESNMKLASGTMPVAMLREAGVAVGLGTDGPASNNDLDMFGALLAAALLHKLINDDPTAMPATDAVAMATIDGARALGMEDAIGSLESGKRADLIVVDGGHANLVPRYDVYSHLTYAARAGDVATTIVDGRVLYAAETFETLDPEAVVAAARQAAGRVREVVGR